MISFFIEIMVLLTLNKKKMKTFILKTVLTASIIGFFMTSCNNSPTAKESNLEQAKQDVIDAQAELDQAENDSISNFNTYKKSIQLKLVENQELIRDLKIKISSKAKVERDIDQVEINRLESRNTELKLKIENYELGPEQRWALFKVDLNNELDDLGKSISSMAERNQKK
jgi:hypothetical protein